MSYPYPVSVIPGPNDAFSLSQGQIQTNFANLIGWSGVDHYAYGETNAGTHSQITFPAVTTQSVPSNPASVLYTKNDLFGRPQLFFLNSQNNASYFPDALNGSTVLMGGIILKWGAIGGIAGGSVHLTFSVPFPNTCFNIQTTTRAIGAFTSGTGVPNTTGVDLYLQSGAGNQVIYWLAIGN